MPTPWSLLSHLDLAAAVSPWQTVATVGETWECETHAATRDPLAAAAAGGSICPSPTLLLCFRLERYLLLSFPSKPNKNYKMFVTLWSENLRFIESRNCACVVRTWLVVFQFSCLSFLCFSACVVNCDELCLSVQLLPVGFFFFLVWLFGFVTLSLNLCLWLVYIDKRDRGRETESRVCSD